MINKDLYDDLYGPGGVKEESEKIKSDARKLKRDIKKEIMQDLFN